MLLILKTPGERRLNQLKIRLETPKVAHLRQCQAFTKSIQPSQCASCPVVVAGAYIAQGTGAADVGLEQHGWTGIPTTSETKVRRRFGGDQMGASERLLVGLTR